MDTRSLAGQRVAIYARYSSDNQREASIDDQVRRCREFVERAGATFRPDLVFPDHAVSGASLQRPAFERMMALVSARPPLVDAIVTEDLSRVTRDFADAAMIFKRLQYLQVPLLGVADGIDTSSRSAKLTFTVKSLVADLYLDELRDKTLRGLEGRAIAGFSTGGLPLGYRSEPSTTPEGLVVGHAIVIDETQAGIVRRIFLDYLAGRSHTGIAATLNAEHVPPPRAHTRHRRKGWIASTIRAVLHNEAYIGEWSFKRREWRKVPGTNKRRPRPRPASEVQHFHRPHLRIIDAELWDQVHERLAAVHAHYTRTKDGTPKGRSLPGRTTPYLLSSLLICDLCGAPMMIAGGSTARYYRCGDRHKRRGCVNANSLREDRVRHAVLDALRDRLTSADGIAFLRRRIAEALGELNRNVSSDLVERRARLTRTEERIKGLIAFIADGDRSEYVVNTLRDLEAQARSEKNSIVELEAHSTAPIRLPTPDEILARVFDLEARLHEDVLAGREELRRVFLDGTIRVRPNPDGTYVARSEILPLRLFMPPETTTPAREQVSDRRGRRRLVAGALNSALVHVAVPFEVHVKK